MNFDYIFNNNIAGDNEEPNREKKRGRKSSKEIQEEIHQTSVINQAVRRQICTIWTDDLHAKFMEAIHQLGEGSKFNSIKCLDNSFTWNDMNNEKSYL